MKKTIVLKDLNSNLVEEAIVVFKENVNIKEKQLLKGKTEKKEFDNENNIAIKEAENVILDYIDDYEKKQKINNQKAKMNILKVINISLVILLITAIIF